jgi:MOSC domain-containing protein YiiM
MGENLTVSGIDFRQLRAGMRFRAGEAFIELTKLRTPCNTLSVYNPRGDFGPLQSELYDATAKAGDPSTPRWAMGGFYAAVVQPGLIRTGDIIQLIDQAV